MNKTNQKIVASITALAAALASYHVLPHPWDAFVPATLCGLAAIWEPSEPQAK